MTSDPTSITSEQAPFLDSYLGATSQPWKLVTHHRPEYTCSTGHDPATDLQMAWESILDAPTSISCSTATRTTTSARTRWSPGRSSPTAPGRSMSSTAAAAPIRTTWCPSVHRVRADRLRLPAPRHLDAADRRDRQGHRRHHHRRLHAHEVARYYRGRRPLAAPRRAPSLWPRHPRRRACEADAGSLVLQSGQLQLETASGSTATVSISEAGGTITISSTETIGLLGNLPSWSGDADDRERPGERDDRGLSQLFFANVDFTTDFTATGGALAINSPIRDDRQRAPDVAERHHHRRGSGQHRWVLRLHRRSHRQRHPS